MREREREKALELRQKLYVEEGPVMRCVQERLSDRQVPGTWNSGKRPEKEVKIWDLKPWREGEH